MGAFRTVTSRVRSWWALGFRERIELFAIVVLAMVAEVAVKVVPLPRLAQTFGIALADHERADAATPTVGPRIGPETIERRAQAVDRVYRHWPRKGSCLRRALVLGYRIRHARPTLWFGVARENGEIRAHAWVTVQGEVIGSDSGEWAPLRPQENTG